MANLIDLTKDMSEEEKRELGLNYINELRKSQKPTETTTIKPRVPMSEDYTKVWPERSKQVKETAESSIGNNKRTSANNAKNKSNDEALANKLRRYLAIGLATVSIVGATILVAHSAKVNTTGNTSIVQQNDDKITREDIKNALDISKKQMTNIMELNGVIKINEDGKFKITNLNKLYDLDLDSEEEFYIAVETLKDADNYDSVEYSKVEVMDSVAQSTKCDDSGERYINYSNVLSRNGYFNESGSPSYIVFSNYMDSYLGKLYKDGNLIDYLGIVKNDSKGGHSR